MIRVRIPELLKGGITTGYALAKASGGRISLSAAHRLVAKKGILDRYDASLIEALCAIFNVPPGRLFTTNPPPEEQDAAKKRR